ncbi:MAG: hypothetical protein QXG97_00130 [Nitrososphaerota archaeon]
MTDQAKNGWASLGRFIRDVGFPVVVACYLLWHVVAIKQQEPLITERFLQMHEKFVNRVDQWMTHHESAVGELIKSQRDLIESQKELARLLDSNRDRSRNLE